MKSIQNIFIQQISSPIGILCISATDKGLRSVNLLKEKKDITDICNLHTELTAEELNLYFERSLTKFSIILDWEGHSDFFKSVWTYLLSIPSGQTRSYLDVAKYLNNPGASRAVGLANNKNPIPIIVPCHRVIGSDGSLTGFASGLDVKQKLLQIENPTSFAIQGSLF